MKHFEFHYVPAVNWRRIKGTTAKGPESIRPHFVPVTEHGRRFAALDAFAGFVTTGFCPGAIRVGTAWVTGYRFVEIPESVVSDMLAELNRAVSKFFALSI